MHPDFCLDTLYANVDVQGGGIITARTDYDNNYPLVLRTTSYNFSWTKVCWCVSGTHPTQLLNVRFQGGIKYKHGIPQEVECERVDSASDERPQQWWTDAY